jgi:hypothetical protein
MSCASILFPIRNQARVPGDNDEKVQLIVPRILLELTSDTAFLSAIAVGGGDCLVICQPPIQQKTA